MAELTFAEKLLHSVVKITAMSNGIETSNGTGYVVTFAENADTNIPCIVTNKHVIAGCDAIRLTFQLAEGELPSRKLIVFDYDIENNGIVMHPSNEIDLCAIPISNLINEAISNGVKIFIVSLGLNIIPSDGDWQKFDAIEDVIMIGCPNGLFDEYNNMPIVRRGITATSLNKMYNNRPEFMVDIACFPGSSGSPVFLYNPTGHFDRDSNKIMLGAGRIMLIGTLYAGPTITANGSAILSKTIDVRVTSMMHLGYVVRSTELIEIDKIIRAARGI